MATVTARLGRLINTQRLVRDPAQLACAKRLDALAARVRAAAKADEGLLGKARSILRGARRADGQGRLRGLYIWGSVGRGKTFLMDLFVETLPASMRQRSHFYRFMREVHAGLNARKGMENPLEDIARQIAAGTRVLCFDELFVSDIGDAMILGTLFEALFRQGVVLVATSNVPPGQLYRDGLQRQRFLPAIAQIEEHTETVQLDNGVDYRRRHLVQGGTYLDSSAADAQPRLLRLFEDLNGAPPGGPTQILVEGRPIEVLHGAPDMVWFDFDAICEGPRSQNDYIDLAHDYHTVFISRVPVFDATREDAARRFIMLVDEFYDRGVKLVLSAAAPPPGLYRGERLRFEFERTASRLIEMQGEEYLARQHRA
ncbi:MAG: cell division protein ZapE [Steroidobacteraceae bacterium]